MKSSRLWITIGIIALLSAAGSAVALQVQAAGAQGTRGRAYIVTVTDSTGQSVSREVITLHADHTMSVTDSAQGGPGYYFTSELGAWASKGRGRIVGRTIDFDLPPSPADLARLDFTLTLSGDRSRLAGSVTVTYFPTDTADPLGDGGTVIGTFTLAGQRIQP